MKITSLLATAAVIAFPAMASAALIDDFSVNQLVADAGIGTVTPSSTVGNRTFTVDNGPAVAAFATSLSSGNVNDFLDFNNQTDVAGWAQIDYTFAGLDLSNGGAFTIDLLSYDQAGTNSLIKIIANGTEVSRMIGDQDIGTLSFGFGSFAGVDFANITSLSIFLDAATAPAVDLALDNFSVAPIPLPAGVILLGTGLAAFGFAKRRKA